MSSPLRLRGALGLAMLLSMAWLVSAGQDVPSAARPYKITIRDEKPVTVENAAPVDAVPRIKYTPQGLGVHLTGENNEQLHLSHFPMFQIDGQMAGGFMPNAVLPGSRFEKNNQPLAKTPGGRERHGFQTVCVQNDLRLTFTCEVAPTKSTAPASKRRQDAVLLRYVVENKGLKPHKFGLRIYMDVFVVTNDGALFAAPTLPNKLLDGIELKGKTLPDYVQLLQNPDLKNPGYVAHLTLNLGSSLEKAERVVLTRHGIGFNTWDMQAMASMGDSALGVFWEPKDIPPGGKREMAYGYGKGIVQAPEGEGQFEMRLDGSCEPGKLFTLTALVADPAPGQALTLKLPDGVELVEGRARQPVPAPPEDQATSVVMWKARVTRTGAFPLQVRSSEGTSQVKVVTVEKAP